MANATTHDVTTLHGTADLHLYRPTGPGPWPAVIFFPDAGGLRPATLSMAARLADTGYVVLLPNVYYRAGVFAPFDMSTVFDDPAERARLFALTDTFTASELMADVGSYLDLLAAQPDVRGDRARCVGYCMGGRHAFIAAGTHGDRIAAAASIHGGGLVTGKADSPEVAAPDIRAQLYFGVADNDRSCTAEHQSTLRSALDAASVRYTLELYPGAAHGFAVPDASAYQEEAAQRHWARVAALFASA